MRKSDHKEWRGVVLLVVAIILFAILDFAGGAEVPTSVPTHSLVRVKLDPGESCFILGLRTENGIARFATVDSEKTSTGYCFTGPPGQYAVNVVRQDGGTQTLLVDIGGSAPVPPGPQPDPPKPDPPKPPDVKPPVPVPDDSTRVLIIYESRLSTRLPPAQRSALFGEATDQWLDQNCAEWRRVDENTAITDTNSYWALLLARKRTQLPWFVVVKNKAVAYEGPVPPTASEFLAQLKQHGGK